MNVLSQSGVVYQISCSQCEAFYVGKTKRRLEQRVQEHSQQGYSSLYKHSCDLCHQIDYSNPAVISVDNNDYHLQIKEALKIKDLKAYKSNVSKTWSVLQDIIKTPTNESDTSQLIINGNIVTDKLKVANEFNKYFNNVGQNLSQNLNSNSNNTFKDYLQNNISSQFSFKKVTTK